MRYVIVWLHAKLSSSYVHVFMYTCTVVVLHKYICVCACVYSYILCVWVASCMSVCRCVAVITLKDNVAFACVLPSV